MIRLCSEDQQHKSTCSSDWGAELSWKLMQDWEDQNGQLDKGATDQLFNAPYSNIMGCKIILKGHFSAIDQSCYDKCLLKHHFSWFYDNKNKMKPNLKTVFPFICFVALSTSLPMSILSILLSVLIAHFLTCVWPCPSKGFDSIFKSMWYKKKHFISYLYCFKQWNSVCKTAFIQ